MKKLTVFNAYFTILSRSFYLFTIRRVFVTKAKKEVVAIGWCRGRRIKL